MTSPVVRVAEGQLRGSQLTNLDGGTFYSFLGIPYAQPPIGELRFKAPLPAQPWCGVRDATKEGNQCYSNDELTGTVMGSEDCLVLNVFTKEPSECKALKPVMVYIHGGGFIQGSSTLRQYGPEFLLTEDIVLVTINYRLGLLGFLTLDDPTLNVPGNAGFKDQRLALKWVQKNIRSFNGDPNNVTLFGESAGSASVHFQVLSESSKGLFHKAIMQSGSAFNHWAFGSPVAEKVAKILGYDTEDEKQILEILTKTPVDQLHTAQLKCDERYSQFCPSKMRFYGAVIEKPNDTAFLTENPIDIISSGKYNQVPLIFGYTSKEGMLFDVLEYLVSLGAPISLQREADLEDKIPWQVNLEKGSPASLSVKKKMSELYFKGCTKEDGLCDLSTDSSFLSGILAAVKNHTATSCTPVYLFRMSVSSGLNFLKNMAKLNHKSGACHADDVGYLFKSILTPEIPPGSLEDISLRRFVKLWTNFAKTGNPTSHENDLNIKWEAVTNKKVVFLDIGENLEILENPEAERMTLWREIFHLSDYTKNFL